MIEENYEGLINCLLPLRLLLLKQVDKGLHEKIQLLMDHNEIRKKDVSTWNKCHVETANFITKTLNLSEKFNKEEINR